MRAHWVILVLVVLALFALPALADSGLMCWTFGQSCAADGTIVAAADGDISGNLYYTKANFWSFVRIIDLNPSNSWTSGWMLNTQNGSSNSTVDFGHALKGDILVIQLCDQQEQPNGCADTSQNQYLFANDPKYSADGLSHAMVAMNGGAGATAKGGGPRSQLIWLEDLADKQKTDWDYNDSVIALHNVDVLFPHGDTGFSGMNASPVPEPATLTLLTGGLMAGVIRRIKKS